MDNYKQLKKTSINTGASEVAAMLCEVVSPGGGRDSTEGILQYSNIFFVPTQYICYATGTIYTAHEFKTNARLREAIQACLVCLKKSPNICLTSPVNLVYFKFKFKLDAVQYRTAYLQVLKQLMSPFLCNLYFAHLLIPFQ